MKILICGAGQVGFNIAQQLAREGNEITLIDQNEALVGTINTSLNVRAIVGHASHPSILEEAHAAECDMIIAVTHSDEVNIVACNIAHALFNVPTRIARIRHQDYLDPKWKTMMRQSHVPIDVVISPEIEVAATIQRRLHAPGAIDAVPYFDGHGTVLSVRLERNSSFVDLPVSIAEQSYAKKELSLVGMVHEGKFTIPTPNAMLREGDTLYLVCPSTEISEALALFGHHEREARRLVIVGGGNIGFYLARAFEREAEPFQMHLVEMDGKRAAHIAGLLERTTVIHGSGLERNILTECDIEHAETVIAVTNDDKTNILSALLAKRLGCQRAVTLVNHYNYVAMLGNLGIDVIVNPRETTVSSILQHVRRGKIRQVHAVEDGAAEIIEAEVIETSFFTGKQVSHLKLPRGVILGAIWRKDTFLLPEPDLVIQAKDRILLLAMADVVKKIERMFSVSLEYF